MTGERISRTQRRSSGQKKSPYDLRLFRPDMTSAHSLYGRIDRPGGSEMLEGRPGGRSGDACVQTRAARQSGMVSMQGLGYKEILAWSGRGDFLLEEAVALS